MSDSKRTDKRNIFPRFEAWNRSRITYVVEMRVSLQLWEIDENVKCDAFGWELLVLRKHSFGWHTRGITCCYRISDYESKVLTMQTWEFLWRMAGIRFVTDVTNSSSSSTTCTSTTIHLLEVCVAFSEEIFAVRRKYNYAFNKQWQHWYNLLSVHPNSKHYNSKQVFNSKPTGSRSIAGLTFVLSSGHTNKQTHTHTHTHTQPQTAMLLSLY
jgi:hypothetical protein